MKPILLFFVLLFFIGCQSNDSSEKKTETVKKEKKKKKKSNIQPPIENLNVPFVDYTFMPTEDNLINYVTGTKIKIPKNAFLDANGKIVKDSVKIQYREFHDPIEILASGIPMSIDSGGKSYTFMSAGMCEFRAYSKNEKLEINPDNPIEVNMSSKQRGTQYDLYYFDENTGKWEKKGKDETTDNVEKLGGPSLPMEQDKNKEIFEIEPGEKPELSEYYYWIFQPLKKGDISGIQGYLKDINIKRLGGNLYELTFLEHHGGKYVVKCNRVYSPGAGYNKVLLKYQKDLYEFFKEKQIEEAVIRAFKMNQTGIFNCDAPLLKEEGFVEFQYNIPENIKVKQIWLLDETINSCFTSWDKPSNKIDQNHINKIIISTDNGNIYNIKNSEISKWKKDVKNECTLVDVTNSDIYALKHKLE